jgi:ABC-type Fe3+ transport system permease subunit
MEDPAARPAREASQWTEPLQAAVAAFFFVSAVVNVVIVVAFSDLYRGYYLQVYQQARLPADQVGTNAEGSLTVVTVITVAVAVVYLLLAAMSMLRRHTWIFIVDMVVLFLAGAPSLVGGVLNLVSPSHSALPQVFGLTQLMLALVALSLFILMLGLSLRYGAWAQRRPAPPVVE